MPICKVLVLTNFPEGNWVRKGDETQAAQSLADSLEQEFSCAAWSSPVISEHSNFRELLIDAAADQEAQYVLLLSSLHAVEPVQIEEAFKCALCLQQGAVLFPSNVERVAKEAEDIRDLLYQATPRLVHCNLPNNTPLRLPGLVIRQDILADFANFLAGPKGSRKPYRMIISSDGMAIALRLFLRENNIQVRLSDGPVLHMRGRCEEPYSLPTIERRLLVSSIHRCLGSRLLRGKKPAKKTRLPLRKRIREETVKEAIRRLMGTVRDAPFEDLVHLSLSQGQALSLLKKANQHDFLRLGAVAWKAKL